MLTALRHAEYMMHMNGADKKNKEEENEDNNKNNKNNSPNYIKCGGPAEQV